MKKVILMVFLIFSLLMIVYGIGFILNSSFASDLGRRPGEV